MLEIDHLVRKLVGTKRLCKYMWDVLLFIQHLAVRHNKPRTVRRALEILHAPIEGTLPAYVRIYPHVVSASFSSICLRY